jgi:thioredoxin 1
MEKKVMNSYYKIGIVVILALVVVVVVMMKNGRTGKELAESTEGSTETLAWHAVPKDTAATESLSAETKRVDSLSEKQVEPFKGSPTLDKNILAMVNGEEVTLAAFNREFEALPQQYREYYKDDEAGFLEELILKHLLLQDARRKKIPEQAGYKTAVGRNPSQKDQIMINVLLQEVVSQITINESELRDFFDEYKDQLPDKNFESVKEQIKPMAFEEKQRVVVEDYINGLKSNAEIVRNEQWIKAQEALIADNPLNMALKSGKPVVADFGRGTCIPCKMMQPILEKLQKDFAGKAEILILDVGEYASLSRKHRVMMIPTQIFFDENGKEVYRHQGFMSEEDILAQLKKMGVE